MTTVKNVTSAPISASYSLTQFSAEWKLLSDEVNALVMELKKNPKSSKSPFESELNTLNFKQMDLTKRVSSLSGNDNAAAQAKIEEIENLFDEADQLLHPKQAPTSKMQIIGKGLATGVIGGIIAGAVKHVVTAISMPRIPVNNSGSLSEAEANALLASHNNQILNQNGSSLNNQATGPKIDGPCFPEPPPGGSSTLCADDKSAWDRIKDAGENMNRYVSNQPGTNHPTDGPCFPEPGALFTVCADDESATDRLIQGLGNISEYPCCIPTPDPTFPGFPGQLPPVRYTV
jgi:hypothetical protein